jgi:hypothetical protein
MSENLLSIEEGIIVKNESTVTKVEEIISTVYSAEIKTNTQRDPTPTIIYGSHVGYPIDNGTGPWTFVSSTYKSSIDKPLKGFVIPGCTLYGEIYDVTLEREHYYSKKLNDSWIEYTTIDTRLEEDVTISIILEYYSKYKSTENDIIDVFYENMPLNDKNLEDTIQKYKDKYYTPNLDDLIKNGSGDSLNETIYGDYESWVETEIWDSLDEILDKIDEIELDPSINSTTYPNPIQLMEEAKNDLLTKYNNNIDDYLNKSSYHDGTMFYSVGKKAVYCARDWYVYTVQNAIENIFSSVENKISQQLNDAVPSGAGFSGDDVKDTLSGGAVDSLKNQFSIPFGLELELTSMGDEWTEKARLAIDQYPNYLNPEEETEYDGEKFYTMKLRNRCTLGPTGLPILPPTPVTPWIITINIWIIDVEGEYAMFKVIDSSDETIFNPLFGHEPQIYVRESIIIKDGDIVIGENTRLSYGFTTVSFAVVPSWGFMVGDTTPDFWDEHTPGYD